MYPTKRQKPKRFAYPRYKYGKRLEKTTPTATATETTVALLALGGFFSALIYLGWYLRGLY